jgi:hypothetical protein
MTKKFLYQNVHKSESVGEHNERARTPLAQEHIHTRELHKGRKRHFDVRVFPR